jgi:hypothetical protein
VIAMQHHITFLDLTTNTERSGQLWGGAPLVTGGDAVWLVLMKGAAERVRNALETRWSDADVRTVCGLM